MSRVIIQIEAPRNLMGRVMSVFNLDQGMRSIGAIVLGSAATLFGASLGIALTASASLIVTTTIFYRLLAKKSESHGTSEDQQRDMQSNSEALDDEKVIDKLG
jgi:hypothetical protein